MIEYPLHIFDAKNTNDYYTIESPFDFSPIAKVEKADENATEQALKNAFFAKQELFPNLTAGQISDILFTVSQKVKNRVEEFALTIALEGGKPLKDGTVEAERAANTLKMCAVECLKLSGHQVPMDLAESSKDALAFTVRNGIGVVLAISAFNHPLNLIAHQVGTALAAGNPVVVKPATQTPISCLKLAQLFYEAGLDRRCLSVLTLSGSKMEKVIQDSRIAYISFIGAANTGWQIQRTAAAGIRFAFEHGGTAVSVVDKKANLDLAVKALVKGAFYHAGQVCVSTQIIYVHQEIYNKFIFEFKNETRKLVTGDPTKTTTDIGPIISIAEADRVEEWLDEAQQMGAKIIHGGNRLSETCIEPTIVCDVTKEMKLWKDEVFGPVVSVISYNKISSVINEVNAKPFSFQTSIFTQDIDKAVKYAKLTDNKTCIINDHTAFRVDWMPFGGAKQSGLGVGGVQYAIAEQSVEKLIVIRDR